MEQLIRAIHEKGRNIWYLGMAIAIVLAGRVLSSSAVPPDTPNPAPIDAEFVLEAVEAELPPCSCNSEIQLPYFHLESIPAWSETECRFSTCQTTIVSEGEEQPTCLRSAGSALDGVSHDEVFDADWCARLSIEKTYDQCVDDECESIAEPERYTQCLTRCLDMTEVVVG